MKSRKEQIQDLQDYEKTLDTNIYPENFLKPLKGQNWNVIPNGRRIKRKNK